MSLYACREIWVICSSTYVAWYDVWGMSSMLCRMTRDMISVICHMSSIVWRVLWCVRYVINVMSYDAWYDASHLSYVFNSITKGMVYVISHVIYLLEYGLCYPASHMSSIVWRVILCELLIWCNMSSIAWSSLWYASLVVWHMYLIVCRAVCCKPYVIEIIIQKKQIAITSNNLHICRNYFL